MSTQKNEDPSAAQLAGIRAERPAWSEQRHQAERAPVDRATAEARLEHEIANAARGGAYVSGGTLASPTYDPRTRGGALLSYRDPAALGPDPRRLLTATLAGLAPDLLRQAGRAAIAETYRAGDGITDTERAARLAAIDAQLAALERDEERVIRSAADAGQTLARRGDADPAVVLAADLDADALVLDPARYWSIRDAADALHAAVGTADDARQLAYTEHQRAQQRLRDNEQRAAARRCEVPADVRALAQQRRATYERCRARYDAAHAAWQPAVALASACRKHAHAHGCDVREPGEGGLEPGGLAAV